MKNTFILYLWATVLMSCTKEVSIAIPEQEALPVLNSIFQTDSVISVTLNQTQPILQNRPNEIKEASVILSENGLEKETLAFDESSFKSKLVAKIGNEYRVSAEIEGFETVTGDEKLVDFPEIISTSFEDSVYIGDEGDVFSQAILELRNKPGSDYYELNMFLRVLGVDESNETEDFFNTTSSDLFFDPLINDTVLQNEALLGYFPTKLVFSDELMTDDGVYKMRINYRPFNSNFITENRSKKIALIVQLRKVSKNYYEYKKTLTKHLENQFSDIWDGVGQPLPVFSNIKKGYGIFAGYSQVTDTIEKQ